MENYIWVVTEVNVDKPIPEIHCYKYKNSAAELFDGRIKELGNEYDFTQEFKKGESFTRIFGNRENDEIKVVLQMLRKELHSQGCNELQEDVVPTGMTSFCYDTSPREISSILGMWNECRQRTKE